MKSNYFVSPIPRPTGTNVSSANIAFKAYSTHTTNSEKLSSFFNKVIPTIKWNTKFIVALFWISIISFAGYIRFNNLNYNVPFNDEAIYIVLGKLGLYQNDWDSFNAGEWMSGLQFLYPSISATAYIAGGIEAARIISVIVGILLVIVIAAITIELSDEETKTSAGLLAAVFFATSPVAIFTSRLAMLDIIAAFLCAFGAYLLICGSKSKNDAGKYFFAATIFTILGALTKYTYLMFVPLLLVGGYIMVKSQPEKYSLFKKYFAIPLTVLLLGFAIVYLSNLGTFFAEKTLADRTPRMEVLRATYVESGPILIFGVLGALVLALYKRITALMLIGAALLPVAGHIAASRISTYNRHLLITHMFLAIIIGLGLTLGTKKLSRQFVTGLFIVIAIFLSVNAIQDMHRLNTEWVNTSDVLSYLEKNVKPGDKVLAEEGAGAILALYEKTYPFNIFTFDFFQYSNIQGENAYQVAVNEGYFDYVQLTSDPRAISESFWETNVQLLNNMPKDTYAQVYNSEGMIIYKKVE